jgi:transglutaminase-like putative cysteine protease
MLYRVTHATTYSYSEPVSLCHNALHLKPRTCPRQECHHVELRVKPEPESMQNQHDYFGNPLTVFTIQEPHARLVLRAESWVEVTAPEPLDVNATPAWEEVRDGLRGDSSTAALDAYQFVFDSRYVPRSEELAGYATGSFPSGRPLAAAVADLMRRIHSEFRYDPRATTVATPVHEVLSRRRGVCQDFAHLAIGCLRSLGLPARYVSGYLVTGPSAGRERLTGADASHAWIAVYAPGVGWIDFDPTNNRIPSDTHVTVAWGRDYDDVSPVRGVILGGGHSSLTVAVDVVPADEAPLD